MAESSVVSAVAGVFCIAAGSVLFALALRSRTPAAPAVPALLGVASCEPCVPAAGAPAVLSAIPSSKIKAASSASAAPGSSLVPLTNGRGEENLVGFHFVRGDFMLPREESTKALVLGGRLAKYDHIKVILEGFADEPGADEKKRSVARRRGAVIRNIFTNKGMPADHITIVATDVALASEWAGTVRVRTQPSVPDLDAK